MRGQRNNSTALIMIQLLKNDGSFERLFLNTLAVALNP